MSTSYFMNIGAYVATVIFAAARLAVGGVLTEPGALIPALLVLGILLIPLASKGGFLKTIEYTIDIETYIDKFSKAFALKTRRKELSFEQILDKYK